LRNSLGGYRLPLVSKLSQDQQDELNSIRNELEEQLGVLDLHTYHCSIGRTESGYTFQRECKQRDCRANIHIRVNINDGLSTVCFEDNCQGHC